MTVSHLTRSRNQLWSDLVGELGGSGSNLTLSEEELIAVATNTYGGSISAKTSSRAELMAALVNGAGGTVSAKTHSETEMMAALANALGGSVSALTGSFNSNLAASVNAAASEGGGGAPEWVPDGAKVHIDFVGGAPQGRAWVDGVGEVAVDTLLGADDATGDYLSDSVYDPTALVASGYDFDDASQPAIAFIGAARTAIMAGATTVYSLIDKPASSSSYVMTIISEDASEYLEFGVDGGTGLYAVSGDALFLSIADILNPNGANKVGATFTNARTAISGDGSAVAESDNTADDFHATLAVPFFYGAGTIGVSITIYDPVDDATLQSLTDL